MLCPANSKSLFLTLTFMRGYMKNPEIEISVFSRGETSAIQSVPLFTLRIKTCNCRGPREELPCH